MRARYPEWELDARTKGIPMMGEGRVFMVNEDDVRCAPFEIPNHYARICGIDFGIEHYGAAAWIAWDRDRDVVYVYDCYRQKNELALYHAETIKSRGNWIPVAW